MPINERINDWLETHWVTPAYSGWVLIGLSCCFFAAAMNTMAGWLYVLSGVSMALLVIAAILPVRSLMGITLSRSTISTVSVGNELVIELELENHTPQPKTLLQVQDLLPFVLGKPVQTSVEMIPPQGTYHWVYYHPTQQRGVYRWQTIRLRTAAPLGLFWYCRRHSVAATAIVYPTVLPLKNCPLIDAMGQESSIQYHQQRRVQLATEGLTRSLRPYRQGDPTRLIHWKSSARYGELRVRELEVITGGEEIIICLDSAATWQADNFEQAVIAAASLYFYAQRQQLNVKLWTSATNLVQGERTVLQTLAATHFAEPKSELPKNSLIWLSQNPITINTLPAGSRYLVWQTNSPQPELLNRDYQGIWLQPEQPLQQQLQAFLS